MKHGMSGQSLGLTPARAPASQAAYNPNDPGQASEPLSTLTSSSVSLACPQGVRRRRTQANSSV